MIRLLESKFQFKADLCRLELCLAGIHYIYILMRRIDRAEDAYPPKKGVDRQTINFLRQSHSNKFIENQ